MKTGWKYKKLGEVVSSINGLWTGKKEPFITIPVISLKNFTKDCKLKKEDYSIIDVEVRQFESRKLQYGDIIIEKSGGSDTQPVGRPILFDIKEGDYSFSNFTTTLRVNDANKELLNSLFLHNVLLAYYRQGKTFSLQSKTTGIHNLDLKGYLNLPIPVPPLPTQQSIVSELDSLSKIIADCKETLKDYDALEQSIFYDMFGDPVKNEKGWNVKKLGEVCTFKNGVNFSKNDKGKQYKFVGVSDFLDKKELHARDLDSVLIEETVSSEYYLNEGDIVFVRSNGSKSLVGRNVLVHTEDEIVLFSGFCIRARIHDENMTPLFLLHTLKADSVKCLISNSGRGCNISNLNQKILDSINVIIPSLSLQNQFIGKISAIEQMKAETKKALQEAETLFNARMDYWFN